MSEQVAAGFEEYRAALAANESAEHWGLEDFLHDLDDWIKSVREAGR